MPSSDFQRKPRRAWLRWMLLGASSLLALIAAEAFVRITTPSVDSRPLHRTMLDKPYLYGLNPRHPDVSSQGLRDREFEIPKPPGITRVMLLGDSVVFGAGTKIDETISRGIARRFGKARIEIMNAGVHGWTPFNELQWFRTEGHRFEPDVVIVMFCMNDVANPYLHWDFTRGALSGIPDDAIPNLDDHRDRVVAKLARQAAEHQRRSSFPYSWLKRSALFRKIKPLFLPPDPLTREVGDRSWSVRITGEDSVPIDVLVDSTSTEWSWLRRQYSELHAAVRGAGAEFVLASVPLAPQLEPDYPYQPQEQLATFSKQLNVDYVPALPHLRGLDPEDIFLGRRAGYDDIWHLTASGLDIVAGVLADHLTKNVLPRLKH